MLTEKQIDSLFAAVAIAESKTAANTADLEALRTALVNLEGTVRELTARVEHLRKHSGYPVR